jgi:putative drug exporter of the RND superfamily
MSKPNLAARAGRWSAAHWKTATALWVAFVVVAVLGGYLLGTKMLTDAEQGNGETARAQQILADADFATPAGESVLVQSRSLTTKDPAFRAAIQDVLGRLGRRSEVANVRSPLAPGATGQISKDGHSALVQFDMKGKALTADERVEPVLETVAAVQATHRSFLIEQFGQASATKALNDTIGDDFKKAETLTVPVTLVILLIAFGSLIAAGLPVMLAFTGVLAAIGVNALLSHVFHSSDATNSVILLVGMAVGVDYSLFYLKREREEHAGGLDSKQSLARASATSGQAVLVSGATVLIAMAGMLFAGSKIFGSIGIGTMIVVASTMVGSITVLPALLGKLGDRVDRSVIASSIAWASRGRVRSSSLRLLPRLKRHDGESRFWNAVLRPVLRFPALAAASSAALLIVLALPVFGLHTKLLSFTDLPQSLSIVRTYEHVQKAFPGSSTPAVVVVKAADVTSPTVSAGIRDLEAKALASGEARQPIAVSVNPSRTVARVEIPIAGQGENTAALHALQTLRKQVIPTSIGQVPGAEVAVTGETAGSHDFNETTSSRAPIVFAFVLGLAFVLLLLTFRSIVVPIKAIVLNLLSVGAAYGILVWIFQDGHLEGLLNFKSNGGIVTWLPLFLFVVLFGLSMDYHVFILSRVKELVDRGMRTEDAVAQGIRTTASTVTAAAAVMVAVFAVFATLRSLDMKQLGVGLAVAVLIDATLIRGVLLPATMKLLGRWNWYLPRWLEWLPNFEIDARPAHHDDVDTVPERIAA